MRIFFLLIMSLAVWASASKYAIRSDEFRLGEELRLNSLMAIGEPGKKILSGKPDFSKSAELYLRRKIDGTNYGFYSGNLNPDPFRSFYAFDLEANKISLEEALKLKFYGKRRTKPYRDETEIYFGGRYLYSPRLPVLYFVQGDEWHRLESVVAPGVLNVVSEDKGITLSTETEKDVSLPKRYFPAPSGIFYANFTGEGFFPLVEAIEVRPNKQNTMRVNLMPAKVSEVSFYPDVYENQISSADSIEKIEGLYDLFRSESLDVMDTLSTKWFEQVYPKIRVFEDTTNSTYVSYAKAYHKTKEKALAMWIQARMAPATALRTLIFKKLEEFESKPATFAVEVSNLEVFAKVDSSKKDSLLPPKDSLVSDSLKTVDSTKANPVVLAPVDSISIHLQSKDNRISVDWVGGIEKGNLAALAEGLKKGKASVTLSVDKNKPVWLLAKDSVYARKHYRFVKVEFALDGAVMLGKGSFRLSDTLLLQPEVQAWLHPEKVAKAEPKKDPVKVAEKDSLKPEDVSPLRKDSLRGEYLVLDSSSFRFRGKVVGISSFAIQTREVTQGDFAKMILAKKLDVKMKDRSKYKGENKPVQNITWFDAQSYCKALGGDLPTEAQWEYVSRAGGNDVFVWESLEKGKPGDYAVYSKNAEDGPMNVGSKQPNAWGVYDMSGNVSEWTRDNYSSLSFSPAEVDPKGSWLGYTKIIKGGSFDDGIEKLDATTRDDEDPRYWSERVGFRCVFPVK